MKNTIKVTIALAFIIGAYLIGFYQGKSLNEENPKSNVAKEIKPPIDSTNKQAIKK